MALILPDKRSKNREFHGMSKTPIYRTWKRMRNRCYDTGNPYYMDYGGRGIRVCDRWRNSFLAFYEDMGDAPEGMSIDRKDVNGDYSPKNCRWATPSTQSNNQRSNINLSFKGKTMTLMQWSRHLGIKYATLKARALCGKSVEAILDTHINKNQGAPGTLIAFEGKVQNISSWARDLGMSQSTLQRRLCKYGWNTHKALTTPVDTKKRSVA